MFPFIYENACTSNQTLNFPPWHTNHFLTEITNCECLLLADGGLVIHRGEHLCLRKNLSFFCNKL